jgi:L-aspartate oxidase
MDNAECRDGRPVVIGAGLAGLLVALHLAPEPVVVLAKAPLGSGAASAWAQGGVAAAVGADDDPAIHAADTLAAGDGLCDLAAVTRITSAAQDTIAELARRGVAFDRTADGRLALGLEAAHRRHRIVHAGGDGSGREIMRALVAAVRQTPSITVMESVEARRLLVHDGEIAGVAVAGPGGPVVLTAARVIIATGGIGGLYRRTTNPVGATGDGLALAARAGAALADMEFVQFHPTALDVDLDPMPLISEAVRGEGAVLVDETGEHFMAAYSRAELEPRDVVARAIWRRLQDGHRVFLDACSCLGARFAERFPGIAAKCRAAGVDPTTMRIPVRPAAHYHMGGIAVDEAGRSSVAGLWACGEAAATGLHGANRLASNSLLEAIVCARWVAESVAGMPAGMARMRIAKTAIARTAIAKTAIGKTLGSNPASSWTGPLPSPADPIPVRDIMTENVGVLRDRDGLLAAIDALQPMALSDGPASDPALAGLLVATAALVRQESRGSHYRTDFPARSAEYARRLTLRFDGGEVVVTGGEEPARDDVAHRRAKV